MPPSTSANIPARDAPAERLAALAVARAGAVAVILGDYTRWRQISSYTLAPAELPGGRVPPDVSPATAAAHFASALLGCQATVLSSVATYGPSHAHAIDRLDLRTGSQPTPLLAVERGLPPADGAPGVPRRMELRVYRGALEGDPAPAVTTSGLLWLPLPALRQAIRGLPFTELLAVRDVVWIPTPGVAIPDDLFLFVPAEYGERHLLRAVAKYGPQVLFASEGASTHGA